MYKKLLSILFLLGLVACSAQGETVRERLKERIQAQRQSHQSVPTLRDVAYGADKLQTMDIYAPKNAKNAPVILMVHGGAWRYGDKTSKDVVDNKVAHWLPKGYVLISANYRMLPNAAPNVQADDVRLALITAQKQAVKWGGDPAKFILMGHSAGAHLVSLVNANPSKMALAKPILGVVSLDSAALDVPQIMTQKHYDMYDDAFGKDEKFWASVSPMHQLTPQAAPYLLVCSTRRELDSCQNAERFAEKAISLNVKANVLRQDLSHMNINENLGLQNDDTKPNDYTKQVDLFIESLLNN